MQERRTGNWLAAATSKEEARMKTVPKSACTASAHRKQQRRRTERQDLIVRSYSKATTTKTPSKPTRMATSTIRRSWPSLFVGLVSLLIVISDLNNQSNVGAVLAKRVSTGLPYNPAASNAQSLNFLISAQQQYPSTPPIVQPRCPSGAPLQWRPYLDAASKAHLAPAVALGSLKQLSLTPIQLINGGGPSSSAMGSNVAGASGLLRASASSQLPAYHPQNVNNAGVNIEATFTISAVPKKTIASMNLRPGQTIRLLYRVSASLSTTNALMTLVNSNAMSTAASEQQQYLAGSLLASTAANSYPAHQPWNPLVFRQKPAANEMGGQPRATCALDLSERELVERVDKIFKKNQNYILFLDQVSAPIQPATLRRNQQQQAATFRQQHQQVAGASGLQQQQQQAIWNQAGYVSSAELSLYPFASHELLTNQTGRAIHRILCKGCAQVPQIQLVNATVVSVVAQQPPTTAAGLSAAAAASLVGSSSPTNDVGGIQQLASGAPNSDLAAAAKNRIKLDCRVAGLPAPWIQWYKNGKLLRVKQGKVSVKTNKWRRRHDIRVSRLEIDLPAGRNETGIYECRAMNVVAREPVVSTYTLLVRPTHYALIPMQAPASMQESSTADREAGSLTLPAATLASANNSRPQATGAGCQNGTQICEKPTSPSTATATTTAQATNSNTNTNSSSIATDTSGQQGSISTAPDSTTTRPPATNTPTKQQDREEAEEQTQTATNNLPASSAVEAAKKRQSEQSKSRQASRGSQSPVVGQSCPREAHDNFCLNKGTCVLIGHIEEYFCNCAEGYHGHRCEYKSLGHQQAPH